MTKTKVLNKIIEHAKSSYVKLNVNDFVLGDGPFNYRCHLNSVQKVEEGKAKKVFICLAIAANCSYPCVHFINQLENGVYQDNTWGWTYKQAKYFLIEEVDIKDYCRIWDILEETRAYLVHRYSNKIQRVVFNFDQYII